jgi:hypothetical protein
MHEVEWSVGIATASMAQVLRAGTGSIIVASELKDSEPFADCDPLPVNGFNHPAH